jgi:drug/metabolite transporter (DMT)-like permease
VVTAFLAASVYSGIGAGLEAYGPGPLSLLRLLAASAALGIYALLSRSVRLPTVRDLPGAALSGLLGFGLYNAALAYGQTTVSAGTAGLLHASVPVFTALLAVAFLGERLRGLAWAGIAVSFSGAALISLGEGGGLRFDAGALLVLLSAISASLYFVDQKPYLERCGALEFTAYSIWTGTLFLSPFLPELVGEARGPDGGNVERGLRGGLRHRGRLRDPRLRLLAAAGLQGGGGELPDPPLALAIAWIWLGETPTVVAAAGGVTTLLGVALVNTRNESRASGDP